MFFLLIQIMLVSLHKIGKDMDKVTQHQKTYSARIERLRGSVKGFSPAQLATDERLAYLLSK
jgi:hypothetical protein